MGTQGPAGWLAGGLVLAVGVGAVVALTTQHQEWAAAARRPSTAAAFAAPSTTTTAVPVTTTAPPTTTTTTTTAPARVRDLGAYTGLGTWIDVYDWTQAFNRGTERVEIADIERMAAHGVQTLYVQTSKWDHPDPVAERARLLPMISRAKALGMDVVAWYLPTFVDLRADMHRLMEASRIPGVDAIAVDIESLTLRDVAVRNKRLIQLSTALRAELPHVALGAIPYPPVVTDVINPRLWPSFPWRALAPLFDVWLPMSYQSNRTTASGYRDGYRYTAENIDRMRARLGLPDAPMHTIGGIADDTSLADLTGILRAARERRVIGGSLYDWRTTGSELLALLGQFRNPARG